MDLSTLLQSIIKPWPDKRKIPLFYFLLLSSICHSGLRTLTWDWSKWMMTLRSAGRSLRPSVMAVPAVGSSCGEKQACSHSVYVIIWTLCILSSLIRNILLRKSFTSWSFMASSSWRPSGGKERTLLQVWLKTELEEKTHTTFIFVIKHGHKILLIVSEEERTACWLPMVHVYLWSIFAFQALIFSPHSHKPSRT